MDEKLKEAIRAFKELGLEPVKEAVTHRVRNPLFGGFVLSWLFFNWAKLLIITFGEGTILQRINFVRSMPDNSIVFGHSYSHTHTFWFPFLISIFLTLVSPFISYVLDLAHDRIIKKTEKNKFERQASILGAKSSLIDAEVKSDTQKETALLAVRAQQEISRADIAKSNANIDSLKKESESLHEQIKTNESTNDSLKNELLTASNKLSAINSQFLLEESKLIDMESKFGTVERMRQLIVERNGEIMDLKQSLKDLEIKYAELKIDFERPKRISSKIVESAIGRVVQESENKPDF